MWVPAVPAVSVCRFNQHPAVGGAMGGQVLAH